MPYDNHCVGISFGGSTGRAFPTLGLALPGSKSRASDRLLDLLIGLRLAHFRVELDLEGPTWRAELQRAAATGLATATALELVVRSGRSASEGFDALAHELQLAQVGTARFVLVPFGESPRRALVDAARSALTPVAPRAELVHEAKRRIAGAGIARSIPSLPTRAVAREVAAAAQTGAGPFAASPVAAEALAHRGASPLGAAFAVSSLGALAAAGASSITYATRPGWGVIRRTRDGRLVVAPAYHVLADVGECDFAQLGRSESSDEDAAVVLCVHTVEGVRLFVANVTSRPRRVAVEPLGGRVQLIRLETPTLTEAVTAPERFRHRTVTRRPRGGVLTLDLGPYGVARIDA
jgi:hypothetical protein